MTQDESIQRCLRTEAKIDRLTIENAELRAELETERAKPQILIESLRHKKEEMRVDIKLLRAELEKVKETWGIVSQAELRMAERAENAERALNSIDAALVTAQEVIKWFASGDTGASSETLAATMMGVRKHWPTEPSDPGDLGRCIRLLERIPIFRERLHEMKSQSERWSRLVDHWEELEALYRGELPRASAPKTYARMREIIDGHE